MALLQLGAKSYTALAFASRVAWALVAFYLVVVLSPDEFGRYSFAQITAGLAMQVVIGVLPNLLSSRMARSGLQASSRLLLIATLYAAVVASLLSVVGALTDILQLTNFGPTTLLAIGAWIFGSFVAAIQVGYALAFGQYGRAALVGLLQPGLYLALILGLHTSNGELVALYAALAAGLPALFFLGITVATNRSPREPALHTLREVLHDHRDSVGLNLAAIPTAVALWLMLNLLSVGDPVQLARYGLANQMFGLFLFLPAALAGVAIPRLTRGDRAYRTRATWLMAGGFLAISVLAGAASLLVVVLPFVPALLVDSRYEIAIALITGGFFAARSPLAWINQIDRNRTAETLALLAHAAVLFSFVVLPPDSVLAFAVRLAAAIVSLSLSFWLVRQQARP